MKYEEMAKPSDDIGVGDGSGTRVLDYGSLWMINGEDEVVSVIIKGQQWSKVFRSQATRSQLLGI